MTDPRGTRRRRRTGADGIPRDLAAWFAGEAGAVAEPPPLELSDERRDQLGRISLVLFSRGERRALGLPVEPWRSLPWSVLLYPDHVLLGERWAAWRASHPDAQPPAGYEWLDDPASPHHPAAWLLAQAHKCATRGRRK